MGEVGWGVDGGRRRRAQSCPCSSSTVPVAGLHGCLHPTVLAPRLPLLQSFGTPSFAAPELLTEGKLTRAADIYSLAMIGELVWT